MEIETSNGPRTSGQCTCIEFEEKGSAGIFSKATDARNDSFHLAQARSKRAFFCCEQCNAQLDRLISTIVYRDICPWTPPCKQVFEKFRESVLSTDAALVHFTPANRSFTGSNRIIKNPHCRHTCVQLHKRARGIWLTVKHPYAPLNPHENMTVQRCHCGAARVMCSGVDHPSCV